MKRQLVAEQWNKFAQMALPPEAPAIQRQAMRRAFYGGAQAVLFRVIEAFAPESEPTAEDLQIMQDVHDELEEFGRMMLQGRA